MDYLKVRLYLASATSFLLFGMQQLGLSSSATIGTGQYSDNASGIRSRQTVGFTFDVERSATALGTATFAVNATSDYVKARQDLYDEDSEVARTRFESLQISTSQTWSQLTETRQSVAYSHLGDQDASTVGLGVSHWLPGEILRLSMDVTSVLAEQQAAELLDQDFEVIDTPSRNRSRSLDLGLRHLATKTTIVDYGVGYSALFDRPDLYRANLGLKQFIPQLDSAVHLSGTRFRSYGEPVKKSLTGELAGWEAELSYLQSLWDGATGQLGYRYYEENEITRAVRNELTTGVDVYSLGLKQGFDLNKRTGKAAQVKEYVVLAKASQFLTNRSISANVYEVSLTTQF